MKPRVIIPVLCLMMLACSVPGAWAHCEIPCGIYDDAARSGMLAEHIRTMEKSINQIVELSKNADKNYNQLVRWIMNKEDHANQFQDIVYQYFMNQRITPVEDPQADGYDKYIKEITPLHKMLVHSMKVKQTTDLNHIKKLRMLLMEFDKSYFGKMMGSSEYAGSMMKEHGHKMEKSHKKEQGQMMDEVMEQVDEMQHGHSH